MFLGGSRPGAEDACVYAAASTLPNAVLKTAPAVKGWINTVGVYAPAKRASWSGGGGGGGEPSRAKAGAKKGKKAAAAPVAGKSSGDDDDVRVFFLSLRVP